MFYVFILLTHVIIVFCPCQLQPFIPSLVKELRFREKLPMQFGGHTTQNHKTNAGTKQTPPPFDGLVLSETR